jgi:hypothetical protein
MGWQAFYDGYVFSMALVGSRMMMEAWEWDFY